MKHALYTSIKLLSLAIFLTACGGGGGDSSANNNSSNANNATDSNTSSDNNDDDTVVATDMFAIDSYINDSVSDSSLTGTWMLVETREYELPPIVDIESWYVFNKRRAIINIQDNNDSTLRVLYCADESIREVSATTDGGHTSFEIEGSWTLNGAILNNTRIEGELSRLPGPIKLLSSEVAMIKISDKLSTATTDRFNIGSLNLQIAVDGNVTEGFDSLPIECFEQSETVSEIVKAGTSDAGHSVEISAYALTDRPSDNGWALTIAANDKERLEFRVSYPINTDNDTSWSEVVVLDEGQGIGSLYNGDADVDILEDNHAEIDAKASFQDEFDASYAVEGELKINL